MKICGVQGVSLIDYPGRVASVLFLGGCNFRCPFCQNADLVLRPDGLPHLAVGDVIASLSRRRSLVDGVVVTGGEPLIHGDELPALLARLHATGFAVKLDTNG
ncbi:MAG: radical SAM protein, partial [Dehalococcoidia bacterium]|nr:radical SAM protein [Dehalococcoidia bacterium]